MEGPAVCERGIAHRQPGFFLCFYPLFYAASDWQDNIFDWRDWLLIFVRLCVTTILYRINIVHFYYKYLSVK